MLGFISFMAGFGLGTVVSYKDWIDSFKIEFPKQYNFIVDQYDHVKGFFTKKENK